MAADTGPRADGWKAGGMMITLGSLLGIQSAFCRSPRPAGPAAPRSDSWWPTLTSLAFSLIETLCRGVGTRGGSRVWEQAVRALGDAWCSQRTCVRFSHLRPVLKSSLLVPPSQSFPPHSVHQLGDSVALHSEFLFFFLRLVILLKLMLKSTS